MNLEAWRKKRAELTREDARGLESRVLCGLATPQDLERIGPASVREIKARDDVMHYRFSTAPPGHKSIESERRRTVGDVVSSEMIDRVGDKILVKGWNLEQFKANPQILYAHDDGGGGPFGGGTGELPVGNAVKIRRGQSAAGFKALLADSEFHSADENPKAELVWRLVSKGALPGRSVGFIPTELSMDDKEREKNGIGGFGELIKGAELLEYSVVPIPANADALQGRSIAAAKSILSDAEEEFGVALVREIERALTLTEEDALSRRRVLVPVGDGIKSIDEGRAEELIRLADDLRATLDVKSLNEIDPTESEDSDVEEEELWDRDAEQEEKSADSIGQLNETVERLCGLLEVTTAKQLDALMGLGDRIEKALEAIGHMPSPDSREKSPTKHYEELLRVVGNELPDALEQALEARLNQ